MKASEHAFQHNNFVPLANSSGFRNNSEIHCQHLFKAPPGMKLTAALGTHKRMSLPDRNTIPHDVSFFLSVDFSPQIRYR